ncbi:MAG: hypothetical protein RI958_3181 [Actinomycetota bacterium]|jgi:peptide/nickel transport system permease protein
MIRRVAQRVGTIVTVMFLVTIATFMLIELVPGDPAFAVLGPNGTAEEYARIRDEMGLDQPVVVRYFDWLGDTLSGDLGQNLVPPVESVSARLSRAIPVNLELAVLALVMALAVSIPLAILSAHRAGSRFDRIVSASVFGLVSVPNFVIGLVLLLIFAVHWRLLPYGQWVRVSDGGWAENLKHAFLPALTLALGEIAIFTRLLRGDMISTLREDFVLAARAKGMPTRHILVREALRPSSFSILTLAGVTLGRLIGGTVVVEQVFALPGLGRTIIDAATKNDYKLVQGGVLVIALAYTLINVLVDITYSLLDPRIRRGQA